MAEELIYLPTPGALPGIPGESHGPGAFLVDYQARTIRPAPVEDALVPPDAAPEVDAQIVVAVDAAPVQQGG